MTIYECIVLLVTGGLSLHSYSPKCTIATSSLESLQCGFIPSFRVT